jgi:peptide-methionine (S)-S-oxide reductase
MIIALASVGCLYVINGCFEKKEAVKMNSSQVQNNTVQTTELAGEPSQYKKATFTAGCFWGVETAFSEMPGVISTTVGYTGGTTENPSYKQVCSGTTGHAEAVEITYDPSRVSYEQLLEVFWNIHDPTTYNRQGPDVGAQYRSAIFYHTPEQLAEAKNSIEKLERSGRFEGSIVTEIKPAAKFYPAEEYHQQYLKKQGKISCHRP